MAALVAPAVAVRLVLAVRQWQLTAMRRLLHLQLLPRLPALAAVIKTDG